MHDLKYSTKLQMFCESGNCTQHIRRQDTHKNVNRAFVFCLTVPLFSHKWTISDLRIKRLLTQKVCIKIWHCVFGITQGLWMLKSSCLWMKNQFLRSQHLYMPSEDCWSWISFLPTLEVFTKDSVTQSGQAVLMFNVWKYISLSPLVFM